MKLTIYSVLAVLFIGLLNGCSNESTEEEKLDLLISWMTGSFNSEEQSLLDSNFYNIHLYMKEIWKERQDGVYLYVEQAASWALEKPYRQRVYHLLKKENK